MKTSELRKMLKDVVKEVFQEEMKEILLEAIRRPSPPHSSFTQPITEEPFVKNNTSQSKPNNGDFKNELREGYEKLMREANGGVMPEFGNPSPGYNPRGASVSTSINGELPEGEVSLSQIIGLTKQVQ